jgi:hypothetical protein
MGLQIGFKNALDTFVSFFKNENTAARTYTFQDRDGTIADLDDSGALQIELYNVGSPLKALTIGIPYGKSSSAFYSGNVMYSGGEIRLVAVYLHRAATITGVKFFMSAQGSYTSTGHNGVALYSATVGSTTLTRVATSTDNGNLWKAAVGLVTEPFSAPYDAPAGLYYVGFEYNASAETTAPALLVAELGFLAVFNHTGFADSKFIQAIGHYTPAIFPATITTSSYVPTGVPDPTVAYLY